MKRLIVAVVIAVAATSVVQAYDLPVVNLGLTSFLRSGLLQTVLVP